MQPLEIHRRCTIPVVLGGLLLLALLVTTAAPLQAQSCTPQEQYRIVKWKTGDCCWMFTGAKYEWMHLWEKKWQRRQMLPNCTWTSWQDTGEPHWFTCSSCCPCPVSASLSPPLLAPEPTDDLLAARSPQETELLIPPLRAAGPAFALAFGCGT